MASKRAGARAPKGYRSGEFPPFAVTVDIVILTVLDEQLHVLLVKRSADPFEGAWALPGGFKRTDEDLDEAAERELREETGVDAASRLTQFHSYGAPGRDPRMDVVTVAYFAPLAGVDTLAAGSDATEAQLWPAETIIDGRLELAFDHRRIVIDAVQRARRDLEQSDLATAFLGPEFTISDLRAVYEAVWNTELDPANFRRSFLKMQAVEPTGRRVPPGSDGGRPAELYRTSDLSMSMSMPRMQRPRAALTDASDAGPATPKKKRRKK